MKCQYCKSICVKNGKQKDGTQKYRCKECRKYQQEEYKYQAKIKMKRDLIPVLIVRNAGFRGIASGLGISVNTVYKTVMKAAACLKAPAMPYGGIYEMDELQVDKHLYVTYAIERTSKRILGIAVGGRNKSTVGRVVNAVLMTQPRRIYTDGWPGYPSLIPVGLHRIAKSMLCRIERLHLTARNRIKMLNRDTLSCVRKPTTLLACLKLLFWGEIVK